MLAAIDIHKAVFQPRCWIRRGGITEERFKASREGLVAWIEKMDGELEAVAIEATTGGGGWRASCRRAGSRCS